MEEKRAVNMAKQCWAKLLKNLQQEKEMVRYYRALKRQRLLRLTFSELVYLAQSAIFERKAKKTMLARRHHWLRVVAMKQWKFYTAKILEYRKDAILN